MKNAFLLLVSILVTACATTQDLHLRNGAADAHKDISENHIQLMEAGTFAIYTPSVAFNDPRFKNIPRKGLPSGCTNPKAMDSVKYAENYNSVMIDYILKHSN